MYIRTKDGRIVDTENAYEPLQWAEQARDYALTEREANTIEELCDRFVVIDKETKKVMNIVAFWEYAKLWVSWKYNIYGAIWTDKGLIYVAKMNSDGKLVLI